MRGWWSLVNEGMVVSFLFQGTTESIKWLTDLVETNHSSLEVLPVPCLCEFLITSYEEQGGVGVEPDPDPASHKAQFKRRRTARENVRT